MAHHTHGNIYVGAYLYAFLLTLMIKFSAKEVSQILEGLRKVTISTYNNRHSKSNFQPKYCNNLHSVVILSSLIALFYRLQLGACCQYERISSQLGLLLLRR